VHAVGESAPIIESGTVVQLLPRPEKTETASGDAITLAFSFCAGPRNTEQPLRFTAPRMAIKPKRSLRRHPRSPARWGGSDVIGPRRLSGSTDEQHSPLRKALEIINNLSNNIEIAAIVSQVPHQYLKTKWYH
jgi:hypothetical protein